jgi:hypothetical protein
VSAAAAATDEDLAALEALWERSAGVAGVVGDGRGGAVPAGLLWQRQVRALYLRGISIDAALQHLYSKRPDRHAFRAWLLERACPPAEPEPAASAHAGGLSAAQRAFWDRNGYLVLRGAAPRAQCEAARQAIWDFLGANAADPASWYAAPPRQARHDAGLFRSPGASGQPQAAAGVPRLRAVVWVDRYLSFHRQGQLQPAGNRRRALSRQSSALGRQPVLPVPSRLQGCCISAIAARPTAPFTAYRVSTSACRNGSPPLPPASTRATGRRAT